MERVRKGKHPVILALASVFFWAWAATAFKQSLVHATPWQVVFFSSLASAIVLGAALLACGERLSPGDLREGAYLGFLNPFAYYLVLLHAYNGLPAQVAMVVNYLWPVVLVVLSVPILSQRISAGSLAGVLVSFGGVAYMALAGRGTLQISLFPLLLAFLSTAIWAVYWLLNARSRGGANAVLLSGFIFGTAYLAVAGLIGGQSFSPPAGIIPWLLYIGVFEMGITYMMWNTALKRASSTATVGTLIFLTPFLALLPIALIVGERIAASTVVGLVLVVAGILVERRFRERGLSGG